ncbi:hypothetical protein [Mycobacterium shigaense]|uniref:Uncharacterized protein n=1 Tax=Mycobacterium shigaense TaxID=722731 RepID=A0A1Z4EG02_9MYCO|nr:hypothetical protein [Mycobacterium shigaense]MEA1124898.1 hypothetical protein [Mycobacterium shigaense]PRI15704.1 hypothetical protein B2J96_08725 [Mycobacterium shigaense]BAX91883.1 hypothetical protein MSG_01730 [Mycobacterium shigaense]
MRDVAGLAMRVLGVLSLAAASAIASAQPAFAAPPPRFPNLDGFAAVPADGYVTSSAPSGTPRIAFSAGNTLACDFYGGPAPAPQPSQDIKCSGELPGMDDIPFPGASHLRPGDCVVGSVNFKGPGYELSRMSYGGCGGNPAALPNNGKLLAAGQKVSYLNVTCAVGPDNLIACLDTTSGDHGFVLQPSGSWAF